jgi:hypothetical protein
VRLVIVGAIIVIVPLATLLLAIFTLPLVYALEITTCHYKDLL